MAYDNNIRIFIIYATEFIFLRTRPIKIFEINPINSADFRSFKSLFANFYKKLNSLLKMYDLKITLKVGYFEDFYCAFQTSRYFKV